MKNQHLLTILIPTCDRAECVDVLLDELLSQAESIGVSIEIIVGQNGPDLSYDRVIEKHSSRCSQVLNVELRRVVHSERIGATLNFLSLIDLASGKYVILFGDDDAPRKDLLMLLATHICEHSPGVTRLPHSYCSTNEILHSFDSDKKDPSDVGQFVFVEYSAAAIRQFEEKAGFITSHVFDTDRLKTTLARVIENKNASFLIHNIYLTKLYTSLAMYSSKGYWVFSDTLIHQRIPSGAARNFFGSDTEIYATEFISPAECYRSCSAIEPLLAHELIQIHFGKVGNLAKHLKQGIRAQVVLKDHLRLLPLSYVSIWCKVIRTVFTSFRVRS